MYHPTTRVLAVLELLQSHGRMTGAELAQRLEVNIRTLRRYITMLQDLSIPIIAERGRSGAYELGAGFKLPPMMFTNDEALALAVGLLAAQQLGLTESVHAVESTRAKLERVMPAELKARVRALTDTIKLDLNAIPPSPSSQVLLTLSSAAQQQRRVHLHYRSSEAHETERDVDPYGLACRLGRWYVVGRCHLRHDLRSFRLDRITEVNVTETRFDRPEAFNALDAIIRSIAVLPRKYPFEILLKTDLATAQKSIMDDLGLLEPHEQGVLLRGSTDSPDWLAGQLATLPYQFEIRETDEIRAALRRRAELLLVAAQMT